MNAIKRKVSILARNHRLDPVELLVALWDRDNARFAYLRSERETIHNKDIRIAREVIGFLKGEEKIVIRDKPIKIEFKNFSFGNIGKPLATLAYLTLNDIERIHAELVEDFARSDDPISPPGVKDYEVLQSALFHPQTALGRVLKYPTVESAAAALMYALSNNHPFHNGNKRAAIVAMLVFLDKHNILLTSDEDELFKTSVDVASHRLVPAHLRYPDAEIYELARWIHRHSKIIKAGERQVRRGKLRQILAEHGCEILDDGRVRRVLPAGSFFKTKRILTSTRRLLAVPEHSYVEQGFLRDLRKDLELDPEHGIDTDIFYDSEESSSSSFINTYKNLLRKLARV